MITPEQIILDYSAFDGKTFPLPPHILMSANGVVKPRLFNRKSWSKIINKHNINLPIKLFITVKLGS